MKNFWFRFGIIFILILGFAMRTAWLTKSPPSLNWDEVALGYNAYSLAQTGKDEFGVTLPISLRSFDDYKPALYSYLTIPFLTLFGLNEFSVRILSAISGTLTILFIYLISEALLKKRSISQISAMLIAIEPWSVHFSRAAFETNLGLAFFLAGIYFTIKSRLKNANTIIGFLLLTLSAYSYHTYKFLFVPIVLVFFLVYKHEFRKNKKPALIALLAVVIISLPLVNQHLFQKETLGRLRSTSILKVWEGHKSQTPNFFTENSIFFISKEILSRYLSYFSPVNLFVRGTPEPTQKIPNFGMFYPFEFIFWAIGFYLLARNFHKQKLLAILIVISALPAAITWNWFYPARVLPLFAFFSIIIAWGIVYTYNLTKIRLKKFLLPLWLGAILFLAISVMNLATSLLFYLPYKERGNWQFGMKQIIVEVSKVEDNYEQIIFETRTAQPHIFALFYSRYPPEKYHREIESKGGIEMPRKNFDVGKYKFRDVLFRDDKELKSTLLVGPDSSLPLEKVKNFPNAEIVIDVNDSEGNLLSRLVGLK